MGSPQGGTDLSGEFDCPVVGPANIEAGPQFGQARRIAISIITSSPKNNTRRRQMAA